MNDLHRIIQIVPSLPPTISGVGDYALLLAGELRRAHDLHTRFVVANPDWDGPNEVNGFPAIKVRERAPAALVRLLKQAAGEDAPVLLHYVGYGYQKRGCPFWLVQGLEAWRAGSEAGRLVTMFHELFAFGPPWRSSFWTSPLQRFIAARLAALSDRCRTNMARYARTLERLAPCHRGRIRTLPVFSNVGETCEAQPLSGRRRQMILFGSPRWRREIYTRHTAALVHACRVLQTENIVDIGAPIGVRVELPVSIIELGQQPSEQVSLVLAESRAGFLSYFDGYLAKSGIFAAHCAHGVLPVLPCRNTSELDGIRADCQYLSASGMPTSLPPAGIQVIADNARAWYQDHSLTRTAADFGASLSQNEPVICRC